ncbi:hypothetical protein [Helicobacter sp. MIT 01-3238]|uniref:hypothetical protein n=1 Tax=Helicobacter sp. MIT 01-3238 TaxID=398627 RepID=UPI000E1E6C89|nr:hypothetical protein [Helicobacter sp. MIT 01-3238]RDU53080.1 hypothetical protein CQA40_05985 [Helicobacter sp. MIT 01-3238]
MALLLNQHQNSCKASEQISLSLSHLARVRHKQNTAWHSCTPHFTHSLFSLHSFSRFCQLSTLAFILAFSLFGGVARADSTKNSDPYKVGIKKPKTGGFVGGEFGIGSAYSYANTYPSGFSYSGSSTHSTFPINVFGGYQWYFYDRPWFHFGVRVRGHIGYTNYNTSFSDWWYWGYRNNAKFSISSHAIQYGVEAQFLWDFLNMGEHTLGWHFAPIGLGGSTFFGSLKVNGLGNNASIEDDLTTTTKFNYLFSTGFHYYYNAKHMVFATYKYQYFNSDYQPTSTNRASYSLIAYNSFMLGYAYKF